MLNHVQLTVQPVCLGYGVGVTNTARLDFHQHFSGCWHRQLHLLQGQRRPGLLEYGTRVGRWQRHGQGGRGWRGLEYCGIQEVKENQRGEERIRGQVEKMLKSCNAWQVRGLMSLTVIAVITHIVSLDQKYMAITYLIPICNHQQSPWSLYKVRGFQSIGESNKSETCERTTRGSERHVL